jgi:hypothetical protein
MNNAFEMGVIAMMYILNFIKIGSGCTYRHTHTGRMVII